MFDEVRKQISSFETTINEMNVLLDKINTQKNHKRPIGLDPNFLKIHERSVEIVESLFSGKLEVLKRYVDQRFHDLISVKHASHLFDKRYNECTLKTIVVSILKNAVDLLISVDPDLYTGLDLFSEVQFDSGIRNTKSRFCDLLLVDNLTGRFCILELKYINAVYIVNYGDGTTGPDVMKNSKDKYSQPVALQNLSKLLKLSPRDLLNISFTALRTRKEFNGQIASVEEKFFDTISQVARYKALLRNKTISKSCFIPGTDEIQSVISTTSNNIPSESVCALPVIGIGPLLFPSDVIPSFN
jgi:hypothetical protein